MSSLFDLAPGRVCRATSVTGSAVSSYLTLSPLPRSPKARGGLLSVALSVTQRFPAKCLAVNQYLALWSPDFPPALNRSPKPAITRPARIFQRTDFSLWTGFPGDATPGKPNLSGNRARAPSKLQLFFETQMLCVG